MVTITTQRGIIELSNIAPDDAQAIMANCQHGTSLFDPCGHCLVIEELERILQKESHEREC